MKLAATLLTDLYQDFLPIDFDLILELLDAPITKYFISFFSQYCSLSSEFPANFSMKLYQRLSYALSLSEAHQALQLIAKLPPSCLIHQQSLFDVISASYFVNDEVRTAVPRALLQIYLSSDSISQENIFSKFFQLAIFENSLPVRCEILSVLESQACKELASPKYITQIQLFLNDDSSRVRKSAFSLIQKLCSFNPMSIASVLRESFVNYLFIIEYVPNLRQRSRIARSFPELLLASGMLLPVYSNVLYDLIFSFFRSPDFDLIESHSNEFLDETARNYFFIGLLDSIAIIASQRSLSGKMTQIIPILIGVLQESIERTLLLSVLKLLYILFTTPTSHLNYLEHSPEVFSVCSKLLATTHSRKTRIHLLKIIGAIGLLDVNPRNPPISIELPHNIDDDLSRQFFHPTRDIEGTVDEFLLFQSRTIDQCFLSIAAKTALSSFEIDNPPDLRLCAAKTLVQILKQPLMYMLSFFDSFVSLVFETIENGDDEVLNAYLSLLSQLILTSSQNTTPFLDRFIENFKKRINDDTCVAFLNAILAFLTASKDAFSSFSSETICYLIQIIDSKKTSHDLECRLILEIFSRIGVISRELTYLIIPQICDIIITDQTIESVREYGISSLTELVRSLDLSPYMGPIVRALMSVLVSNEEKTQRYAFVLLRQLVKSNFFEYGSEIQRFLQQKRIEIINGPINFDSSILPVLNISAPCTLR